MIGQNSFTETEDSPLTAGADGGILTPDPEVERERIEALEAVEGRARRGRGARGAGGARPGRRRRGREHHAGDDRRRQGGRDHRRVGGGRCARPSAPTAARPASTAPPRRPTASSWPRSARRVDEVSEQIGHRIKILVGKPGLDGHSNGAEQIALRARDVGMEVIYQGIRLTPEEIAESALQEDVDVVGLSILSGSHLELIPEVVRAAARRGRRRPGRRRRDHPAGRRRAPARGRRRRRLHAEGLRHQPDHGRDRRAGRRARRRRRRCLSARLTRAEPALATMER